MSKKVKINRTKLRQRLNLVAKAKSFKSSQQQKYMVTKKYFASEEPVDEQEFARREREFLRDLFKLLLYLVIVLVIYFFLLR